MGPNFESTNFQSHIPVIANLLDIYEYDVKQISIQGRSIIVITSDRIFQIKGMLAFLEEQEERLHTGEGYQQYYIDPYQSPDTCYIIPALPDTIEGGLLLNEAEIEYQSTKQVLSCQKLKKYNITSKIPVKAIPYGDKPKNSYGLLILEMPKQIKRVSEVKYNHETLCYILGRTLRILHDNGIFGAISHIGNLSIDETSLNLTLDEIKNYYSQSNFPEILLHDLYLTDIRFNLDKNQNMITKKVYDIMNLLIVVSHVIQMMISNDIFKIRTEAIYYVNNSLIKFIDILIESYFFDLEIDEDSRQNLVKLITDLVMSINIKVKKIIYQLNNQNDYTQKELPEFQKLLLYLKPWLSLI